MSIDDFWDGYAEFQQEGFDRAGLSAVPDFPLLAHLMDLRDFVRNPEIVGPELIDWWNRALPSGLGPWLETMVREALDAQQRGPKWIGDIIKDAMEMRKWCERCRRGRHEKCLARSYWMEDPRESDGDPRCECGCWESE